jgi:hypothetical protein
MCIVVALHCWPFYHCRICWIFSLDNGSQSPFRHISYMPWVWCGRNPSLLEVGDRMGMPAPALTLRSALQIGSPYNHPGYSRTELPTSITPPTSNIRAAQCPLKILAAIAAGAISPTASDIALRVFKGWLWCNNTILVHSL